MIEFMRFFNNEDIEIATKLFITKESTNIRVKWNEYYFTIKELEKTYIVTIEDDKYRKIVNSTYSKRWFETYIINEVRLRIDMYNARNLIYQ